jgi:hypothetical protein
MVHTPEKLSRMKIIVLLTIFILVACVLVAGCSTPSIKSTNPGNSSTPAITPTFTALTPAAVQTTIPGSAGSAAPENKKGQLTLSIGDYPAEQPVPVLIDTVSAGVVSPGKPLNLTVDTGRHTVRICVTGSCLQEDVLVLSSTPATLDFGERLKKELATRGSLTVSIGGYDAELPVIVDDAGAGNVSMGNPLNLMLSEGRHLVTVCVGRLCENETVEIKFAHPVYIDFGERLKKDMEFTRPTIRIVDTRQINDVVTVDVEFINPSAKDITMTATIRCTYSSIDPISHRRSANSKQDTVTTVVNAGDRTMKSLDLTLTGGSVYNIEIPVIVDTA